MKMNRLLTSVSMNELSSGLSLLWYRNILEHYYYWLGSEFYLVPDRTLWWTSCGPGALQTSKEEPSQNLEPTLAWRGRHRVTGFIYFDFKMKTKPDLICFQHLGQKNQSSAVDGPGTADDGRMDVDLNQTRTGWGQEEVKLKSIWRTS